jgi:hypothetical protein
MNPRINAACVDEARVGRVEILRAIEIIREGGNHHWVDGPHVSRSEALETMITELDELNTWIGDDNAIESMTSTKFNEDASYEDAIGLVRKMKREVKSFEEGVPHGAILNWVDCERVKECIPRLEKKIKLWRSMIYTTSPMRMSVRAKREICSDTCRWCNNSEFETIKGELCCLCCGSFKQ